METNGPFWEERLLRPIDIYPEYRRGGRTEGGEQVDDKHLRLVQYFLNIETDEGIVGRAGPVGADVARLVLTQLAPIIVSKDPRAIELLWDQMHRLQVHGRQGDAMIAISAVDCALWNDLGTPFDWGRDSVEATLTALAYDDVSITGGTLVTSVAGASPLVPTDEGKVFGQVTGKLNFDWSKDIKGLSSYVEGEVRGRSGVFGTGARVGVRYSW